MLVGHGSTTVWLPNGETRSFEWGPRALFAIPLNCQYQIFNNSGVEPVRLSCTNDAPITINLYHNLDFVFDNPFAFPDRAGLIEAFRRRGRSSDLRHADGQEAIRNVWETNFVHDLTSFKLYELEARGKGSIQRQLRARRRHDARALCRKFPTGRYKKAHRHAAGTHVHAVDGEGYSLLWYEGDSEFKEFPWKHGFMYTPPFWMFHQHFNTCAQAGALSRLQPRQPALSVHRAPAQELRRRRRGLGAAGRPADRVRGSGSAHPPQVARSDRARTASSRRWATSSTSRRSWPCRPEKLTGVISTPLDRPA